jgi:hypothetical protein
MVNQTSMLDYWIDLIALVALIAGILWLMIDAVRKSDDPLRLAFYLLVSIIIVIMFISGYRSGRNVTGLPVLLVALWGSYLITAVGKAAGGIFDGGNIPAKPEPLYSIAEGRRNAGQYLEAIAAIQAELANFPTDFKGQMLLAEIQAENLRDIGAAQETIQALAAQPGHDSKNISFALNRLADWHLKLDKDVKAAKQAIQWIIELFPGTEAAYQATQRLAHMDKLVDGGGEPQRFVVKEQNRYIALEDGFDGLKPAPEDFEATAAKLVRRLEAQPDDNEARELLAILYARHFHRMDLACELIEQMLAQPGAPTSHRVHWLNLLADLHISVDVNPVSARQALQRIIETCPGTVDAEKANQRLLFIDRDLKNLKEGTTLRIGEYEQNIGLKNPKYPAADKSHD